jgi:uncharacterized protein
LAFADFAGNRQPISVGNLANNDRVALILVDHANRVRLKVLGHLQVHDLAGDATLARRRPPSVPAPARRALHAAPAAGHVDGRAGVSPAPPPKPR